MEQPSSAIVALLYMTESTESAEIAVVGVVSIALLMGGGDPVWRHQLTATPIESPQVPPEGRVCVGAQTSL